LKKQIRVACESACSDKNFVFKLLQIFFTNDELCVPNLNVHRKNMRGNSEQIDQCVSAVSKISKTI
jgi:hypothetical protein